MEGTLPLEECCGLHNLRVLADGAACEADMAQLGSFQEVLPLLPRMWRVGSEAGEEAASLHTDPQVVRVGKYEHQWD